MEAKNFYQKIAMLQREIENACIEVLRTHTEKNMMVLEYDSERSTTYEIADEFTGEPVECAAEIIFIENDRLRVVFRPIGRTGKSYELSGFELTIEEMNFVYNEVCENVK